MSDPIRELYHRLAYPAMSHPASDPAVSSVVARMVGLETPPPLRARILEIGCSSGHNLIPLAMRWPESKCVGIDFSESAIGSAVERAAAAGVRNVEFQAADLLEYAPSNGPFDFIVAHGFLSWVPDRVQSALFDFCRRNLSSSGIATISFNLESGWAERWPVIQKTRAIQQARGGDPCAALEILRFVTEPGSAEIAIIDDMLAKGPAILACDDFAPINEPWSLERFVQTAGTAGLRWLGESDPSANIPCDPDHPVVINPQWLRQQLAAEVERGGAFRSCVLCRMDATLEGPPTPGAVLDLCARSGVKPDSVEDLEIWQAIHTHEPACVLLSEVFGPLTTSEQRQLATRIHRGILKGWIRPRIEPLVYEWKPRERPLLNRFRLFCAANRLPLVDAWHVPCQFPERHYDVLAMMDGTRDRAALAAFSRSHCPELAFEPWLHHLAHRGLLG